MLNPFRNSLFGLLHSMKEVVLPIGLIQEILQKSRYTLRDVPSTNPESLGVQSK